MRLIDADKFEAYSADGTDLEGEEFLAYLSGMQRVLEDIDAAPTIDPESLRPRWIPVSDRLPETGEVLATNGDVIAVAPASSVRRKDTYITHWMPLPELPGGGDPDDPA